MADDPWREQRISLVARAGSIRAVTVHFDALVLDRHWSDMPADPAETPLPLDRLRRGGADAILIRSHPIAHEPPVLDLAGGKTITYVPRRYNRSFIDMAGSTYDDYMKKFSSKSRSTLLKKVKKLAAASAGGKLDLREYRTPDEVREFHRVARDLSTRTYQEKLFDKGLPDDASGMCALAAADTVRAYLLFFDGAAIAYLYCPVEHGVLLYDYLGYDPAFKDHSPGTVLQLVALQMLFAEKRYRMFDFTEGEGPHKEFFATGNRRCADIYHFRRTPRNLVAVGLHSGVVAANAQVLHALDRWGVKSKVKTFVREKLPSWLVRG